MTIRSSIQRRGAQRGYSLAEIMVVMAIFTIIVVAALLVYDRSNKVFKQSVESADMQQSTRVAFDKLVADIRLAGFDYDRDGIPFGSLSGNWTKTTAYVAGNLVQPVPPNGHVYTCTNGGTSGGSAPLWKTGSHDVTDDNGVKWEESGTVQYQQPDEAIEYAGAQAIVLRANFNYETALGTCPAAGGCKQCENGREQCLESAQFPLVTTNNQEIVTYALVSNSGNVNANKDTIKFFADTDIPRDVNGGSGKAEAGISVTGVDLTNKYPPYTLYRYTLKDDGTPDAGVPIADNIRSINIRYFSDTAASDIADATGKTHEIGCGDASKCDTAALPLGAGQFDGNSPDAVIAERDTRATIKSMRLTLIGMNPVVDNAYTDTTDTVAPHYRKLQLDTVIVPRNLGKHGMKEFTTTAPGPPTLKTICVGACAGTYATWTAPGTGGDIDSYNIVYSAGDCSASPLTYSIAEDAGKNLGGYASKATPGTQYRFAVQSVNKYGSQTSNCIAATPINKVTPSVPTTLGASGGADPSMPGKPNQVQIVFPPTTTNKSGKDQLTCNDGTNSDVSTIPWAEKIFYRLYRSTSPNFTPPGSGTKLLDESSAIQPTVSGSNLTFTDTGAANCLPYYYKLETVNFCVTNGTYNQGGATSLAESGYYPPNGSNGILGQGTSTQIPAAPTGLAQNSISPPGCTTICDVTFRWLAVTQDTGGNPMNIGRYKLYVSDSATGNPLTIPPNSFNSPTTTTTLSYQVQNLDSSSQYTLQVSALDCNEGAKSASITWPCAWNGGTITVTPNPSYGTGDGLTAGNPWSIEGGTTLQVVTSVSNASVDYTVTNNATGVVISSGTVAGPGTTFNVPIPDLNDSNALARVRLVVNNAAGTCSKIVNRYVIDEPAPNCALLDEQTAVNQTPTSHVVTFSTSAASVTLKNTSTDVLQPLKVIVNWDPNYTNGNPKLSSIVYPSGASTATFTSGCGTSVVVADISSNAKTISSLQSNYGITINFSKNGVDASTISSICIQYRTPFGDIKTCQIYPNANPCTDPGGGACQ